MKSSSLLIFLVGAVAFANCEEEAESLFSEAMRHMGACSENIDISMGLCIKMLDEDTDRSDTKFDSCKAMGVCMSEKFGTMVGNDYDFAKMRELKERITNEENKAEAEKVITGCTGTAVGPTPPETMMNMATCALKESPKWKEMITKIAKSMVGDDDEDDQ